MGKQASSKKTMTSGAINESNQTFVNAIGFDIQGKSRSLVRMEAVPTWPVQEILREGADETMLSVLRWYMEERSKRCYREGLDRDLMAKLDKIFVKYFEKIG